MLSSLTLYKCNTIQHVDSVSKTMPEDKIHCNVAQCRLSKNWIEATSKLHYKCTQILNRFPILPIYTVDYTGIKLANRATKTSSG